jgi:hypothetical protein
MNAVFVAAIATTALFVAFLINIQIGFRIGSRSTEEERRGTGVIEGAVLGLLGLLLAFTFGTGIAHLDARRQLVVAEANAIEVAYSRVDLLDPREQPNMRRLFADYVNARLAAYRNAGNFEISEEAFTPAESIQIQIWRQAARARRGSNRLEVSLSLFPALNDMFDIATERKVALSVHDPALVLALLIGVGLMSCLIGGYALSAGRRGSPLHTVIYALTLAITIYTVIDLDYPRFGLIRIDAADRALTRVQQIIEAQTPVNH